ncbi:hypothetical protein [Caenimonas sedimenti]|uniref:hypothetical protein n=1 Tax=Caenimonas sedimenti TaxID=2596921 RepID=UPI00164762E2|nr:hypothetical protein [Caenimonas sedimenti]
MSTVARGRHADIAEAAAITLAAWAAFCAIVLLRGEMGLSWDALNHHIYLGWTAAQNRFDLDVLPASYQTYQFPYLYWPVYALAAGNASGVGAGLALATLHVAAVPPLWLLARLCISEGGWWGVGLRAAAVVLAFVSGLVLTFFDSTANDLLASVPVLWAVVLSMGEAAPSRTRVMVAGLLGGLAVACKLSNGPLVLLLAFLWAVAPGTARVRAERLVAGCLAIGVGFVLSYGYWGWLLWRHFGNPFFPFLDASFEPVRAMLGWQP